ncbi:hypothetical protein DB347_09155 [Opitutaceae bacterium EW11]|nr:hypothetical protein DB347_09155 [Opitutaceae bacterium EW11]
MTHHRRFHFSVEARLRLSLCLLFGALTAWTVWEPIAVHRGVARLAHLSQDVRAASTLLGAIEDEGAWATAVAASGATRYITELNAAAAETDRALGEASPVLRSEAVGAPNAPVPANASAAEAGATNEPFPARLQRELAKQRKLVVARQQSSQENALVYRELGDSVLRAVETMASGCPNLDVSRKLARWLDLLRLQQTFSAERANTAAVLTDDTFGPDSLRRHWQTLAREQELLARLDVSGSQTERWQQVLAKSGAAGTRVEEIRAVLADKQSDGAFGILPDEWTTVSAEAARALRQLGWAQFQEVEATAAHVRTAALRQVGVALFGGCVALATALGILQWHGRALRRTIGRANQHLEHLAARISDESAKGSSSGVSLAEGAERQIEALQRSVPAVKQLAANSAQNARHAVTARECCEASCRDVEESVQGARELAETLRRLSTAGDRIGEISRTVEEIAFQTNLLALNASIEAARAGAAGAGFAVVADEVRALAHRSAEAAKSSGEIVQSSSALSRGSVELVNRLETRLAEADRRIGEVATRLGQIGRASDEQSRGAQELQTAVLEIEAVTQSNRASAVELGESSETLLKLDETLREAVGELGRLVDRRRASEAPLVSLPTGSHTARETPVFGAARAQFNG